MVDMIENACRVYLGGQTTTSAISKVFLAVGVEAPSVLVECSAEHVAPYTRLTWTDYIKAGVHPVDAVNRNLVVGVDLTSNAKNTHMLGHPLNVAMMFAKFLEDAGSAARCVEALHQIVSAIDNGSAWGRNWPEASTVWHETKHYRREDRYSADRFHEDVNWVCPDPDPYGLSKLALPNTTYMNFSLIAWYSTGALKELLNTHMLSGYADIVRACNTMQLAGVQGAPELLDKAAERALSRFWEEKRLRYKEIAYLLRVLPHAQAASRIQSAHGTKALFGLTLKGADSASMSKGLSALAQQGEYINYLSSLYGRAPTVQELCSLRAKKLVEILYYMPQPLLAEVLEEDQAGERLRARLLREVGTADPTLFRAALIEHDKRATLDPYPTFNEPTGGSLALVSPTAGHNKEWDAAFGELAIRYRGAMAFRSKLEELLPNKYIRAAATVAGADNPNRFLINILETLPEWPEVAALLKGFAFLQQPLSAEAKE